MFNRDSIGGDVAFDESCPHLLIVEGPDDAYFFEAACRHLSISNTIEIRCSHSQTRQANLLKAVVGIGTHLRTFAVVRDADADATAAFHSVVSAMRAAGLPQPRRAGQLSTDDSQGRATAVLILPESGSGALETVCLQSLASHPLVPCIETFLQCSQAADPSPKPAALAPALPDKMRILALLAVGTHTPKRLEPGRRFGEASQANIWDWTHPAFEPVLTFLSAINRP